jgi:threonine dehydrogenase-like Zn-dependent dehydrogenase
MFDVVIDGAGGDGVKTFTKILRLGGIIVSYGMTVKPQVDYTMAAVLRNIEIRGSTMVRMANDVDTLLKGVCTWKANPRRTYYFL